MADPSFGIPPEIEEGDRGMIGDRSEESRAAGFGRVPVKNKGALFLRSKLHTRPLVLTKVVPDAFMAGASCRYPSSIRSVVRLERPGNLVYGTTRTQKAAYTRVYGIVRTFSLRKRTLGSLSSPAGLRKNASLGFPHSRKTSSGEEEDLICEIMMPTKSTNTS